MLQSSLLVSHEENGLLWTIRELGFGELYGVEISDRTREVELTVNKAERDLIEFIRGGMQYIDILHVHQGAPCLAEIDFKLNSFRCRKRIRFPTSLREEGC
jgi:hypothetical protein